MVVSAPGERGKEARKTVKRSSQREWAPPPDRQAPRDVLAAQDASRVPELVPIRYGRMLASPFSFFRGAAAIMAADLGRTPSSGLIAQLCGDAHLSNFGVFAAPDRRLVFDLNDFDESHPGPFEWDVTRLAASFAVAGRERGLSAAERRRPTLESVRMYRTAMRQFAGMRDIEVWYARCEVETVFEQWRAHATKSRRKALEKAITKARHSDIFLGWVTGAAREDRPREFYIRQLWDGKLSANPDLMVLEDLESYARLCGWTLARAHARSGDGLAIAAYLGAGPSFDDAIADFAEAYADQNQRDYDALRADVKAGTLAVEEGV